MAIENYILPAAAPRNPIEDMNKYLTYNYNAQLMADKQAEQNLAMEQQRRYDEEQALFLNNPKPTVKDAVRFMGAMTPQQQAGFKPVFDQIDQKELRSSMMFGSQVMSALETDPAVAQRLLKDRAEAERNSGNADNASFIDQIAAQAASSPENAMKSVTMFMSTIPGAKDFFDAQYGAGQESRAQALAPYQQGSEMALAQQRQTASQANLASAAESYAGVGLKKAQTQAALQEKLPESIRTAEWFRNQSPEVQQNFKDVQLLRNPTTTVNVNNIDQAGEKALGNLIPEFYNKATSSFRQINEIQGYKKALDNAITGPLAEQRTALEEVMFSAGLSGSDGLTATTEIVKGLAKLALDSRQLISGQGQGTVTDSEQKLLTQAASAPQSLTKPQLKKVLEIAEKAAKANNKQNVDLLGRVATKSDTGQLFEESYYSVTGQEKPLKETKSPTQGVGATTPAPPPGFEVQQ
jgi:hypothetical protein